MTFNPRTLYTNPGARISYAAVSPMFGRTRFGVFTNLGPSEINRRDRACMGLWYLDLHLGCCVVEFIGRAVTV